MNLWTYWETKPGDVRPEYLDLCEETWRRHCAGDFTIVRVTPETVDRYAPGLIDDWHKIPTLAHKADYLRAVLLHRHGGIWLDADTIVLCNLRVMIDKLEESKSDFLGVGRPGKRPSNGVLCATAGCKLLEQYIEQMDAFIASRQGDLKMTWTALGYQILWPLTRSYDFFQYPFRICLPVPPGRYPTFFRETPLNSLQPPDCDLRDDTLAICLFNAMFPPWFKRMPREKILASPMVIAQLLRRALGIADSSRGFAPNSIAAPEA
jgi:hypothetical protein